MNKPSDFLDFTDKVTEIHNCYVEEQKKRLVAEIRWLDENEENPDSLRAYLAMHYNQFLVLQLDDASLHQLALIHGNTLNAQLNQLCRQKINTMPLKVIVQELKYFGQ